MRSRELFPAPAVAAGRLVLLDGGDDAPQIAGDVDGWTRVTPDQVGPDESVLVCVAVGPSGSVVEALPVLTEVRAAAIVLLGAQPPNDPRLERAAVWVASYGYRVDRVADLDDGPLLGGIVLLANDEDADDPGQATREAKRRLEDLRVETAGGDTRSVEALQRRLRAAEWARAREAGRASQLEQDLRWSQRELALERRRLTDVERSTSYRLGQAVVQGVKDPRSLASSSRDLLDRWRRRGSGDAARAASTTTEAAAVTADGTSRPPIVTTVPSRAAPDRRNAVAAIVTDRTAAALEDDVLLTRLLPHDAADLIAAVAPTAVLLESEAFAAGNPWAGAGSGAVPARDRELAAVIDAADRVGAASVVVWSGPRWRAPGLAAIASRSTLEVAADQHGFDWVLGVPPARAAASEVPADDQLAVLDGPVPPRLPADIGDRVVRVGADVGSAVLTDPWSVWARHAAWLVPTDGPDRWQVAAAAIAGRAPIVLDDPPSWARAAGASRLEPSSRTWDAPDWTQRRRAVLDGSTAASLGELGGLLGRALLGPTARSVALQLTTADDAAVEAVLAQDHLPPGSVVVSPSRLPDRARAALEAVGLRSSTFVPGSARFRVDLDAARHGPGHLGSLLAGWELTRRPVVGLAAGTTLRPGRLDEVAPGDLLVERDHLPDEAAPIDPATPVTLVPAAEDRP